VALTQRTAKLSREDARRLVLLGQGLAGEPLQDAVAVVERLGRLQVDPTMIVDRAERLALWSRLAAHDGDGLRRALEEPPRRLFTFPGFILPVADLPFHRPAFRRFPRPEYTRGRYIAGWLHDNAGFRAYVLDELRRRGPLRSRDLDDRAEVPWRTGGWNDGKNTARMLDLLWRGGEVAVSRRTGTEYWWDLFARVHPGQAGEALDDEVPDEIAAIELMERDLHAHGLVRPGWGSALDYRLPAREVGEASLRADGVAVPATVEGTAGEWLAHRDLLGALRAGGSAPRTTLVGPFDPLIADRERTAELFGFAYRLELYLPAARREFGPYAMPILDGDRLIGRIDAALDRRRRVLALHGVFAEPGAPADAAPRIAAAIRELAAWLGAEAVEPPADLPAGWETMHEDLA
jgi:uncharacterized protein YcaQ